MQFLECSTSNRVMISVDFSYWFSSLTQPCYDLKLLGHQKQYTTPHIHKLLGFRKIFMCAPARNQGNFDQHPSPKKPSIFQFGSTERVQPVQIFDCYFYSCYCPIYSLHYNLFYNVNSCSCVSCHCRQEEVHCCINEDCGNNQENH